LVSRHWCITDCNGMSQEVDGPGVVGEQPVLKPGEQFEYSSYTSLAAPSGIMAGTYKMNGDSGRSFEVAIPAFSLDSPEQLSLPN
jgi:ApaG protein